MAKPARTRDFCPNPDCPDYGQLQSDQTQHPDARQRDLGRHYSANNSDSATAFGKRSNAGRLWLLETTQVPPEFCFARPPGFVSDLYPSFDGPESGIIHQCLCLLNDQESAPARTDAAGWPVWVGVGPSCLGRASSWVGPIPRSVEAPPGASIDLLAGTADCQNRTY